MSNSVKMEKTSFKRIQIAGLFVISFLGMMLHMVLYSHVVGEELFGWAEESLLNAMKTEEATLGSVA